MDYKKMIVDGITYNLITDEELEKIKHIEFFKNESKRIFNDVESTSISFDTFEERFKKRYGL